MKQITKYIAEDGTEFYEERECEAYEKLLNENSEYILRDKGKDEERGKQLTGAILFAARSLMIGFGKSMDHATKLRSKENIKCIGESKEMLKSKLKGASDSELRMMIEHYNDTEAYEFSEIVAKEIKKRIKS